MCTIIRRATSCAMCATAPASATKHSWTIPSTRSYSVVANKGQRKYAITGAGVLQA